MLKKIINKILGRDVLIKLLKQSKELEWAHIYHDSIRGKPWLENLPIHVGRWAGNYSFFYVLNRILSEARPKTILEFGLGESSKIISTHIDNDLTDTKHDIIEQSQEWSDQFNKRFDLTLNSKVFIHPLTTKNINGYQVNSYDNIEHFMDTKYEFYLVDGPKGSPRFSRYDIVPIAESMTPNDQFIILIDDYNREGEKDTYQEVLKVLRTKNIEVYSSIYSGNKSSAIITTSRYKFLSSL